MITQKYIVVGAGLFGATVAEKLSHQAPVLIIDRRPHLAGNVYSHFDEATGIEVHDYGSHIFHTESDEVWDYITQFTDFNNYTHTVNTRYQGELYPMPINLDTINKLYGQDMDAEGAERFVAKEAKADSEKEGITDPQNFEEKGISLVGRKLYEAFLKGYTEKQWNTKATNLSADILKRIPVRFSHDNRYFITAKHQGIPVEGYTKIVENMLSSENIETRLSTSFKDIEAEIPEDATVIYCGPVDELLDYELGVLPYRSLRFETEVVENSEQKEAVINEADPDVPYTRTHNFKYYQIHRPEVVNQSTSILMREYPADFSKGAEPYYPVNTEESEKLYQEYVKLAKEKYPNLILGGRLGAYRYWDMDVAIKNALELVERIK
ncbi:MAG: UDP-galactopyranose mutase [Candidatus Saccharibacteria bacterium]|nr:UDP-galactopyranose mutase [Candidatus Saccharibacteria bacterium]